MNKDLQAAAGFSLVPKTMDEAMKYAKMIANSDIVPKDFKGNDANVLVAIQMGQELGLPPLQALQNIAVINGRPGVYGDSLIAICRGHAACEYISETFDEATMTATCTAKRKGEPEQSQRFTKADAEIAGLWGKQGPWKQYPKRMLQMRARGFCLRDVFPDALRGVQLVEEIRDIPPERDITPAKEAPKAIEGSTKTESLASKLEAEAVTAEIVDTSTGEIEPDNTGLDPVKMAEAFKVDIANIQNPQEWNAVAARLAESQSILGGRYPSLKKKITDKRDELQKSAEAPAPTVDDTIPGEDDLGPIPGMDDDPGF